MYYDLTGISSKLFLKYGPIFICFCFYFHYYRRWIQKDITVSYVKECSCYVFSRSFMVSGLTLIPLIPF